MTATTAPKTSPRALLVSAVVAVVAIVCALCIGAVPIPASQVFNTMSSHLFGQFNGVDSTTAAVIWQMRLPRVLLALLVGSMLASAGCAYQGTFRNPLADPYLLGISAGASLGATSAIVAGGSDVRWVVPIAAFAGAMLAVGLTYTLGRATATGRSAISLVLAGVAVASLLTATQTLIQQRNADKIREVYGWMLGRLTTSGWHDVLLVAPYVVACIAVLIQYRRVLDVFAVGDEEATTMGLPVARSRAAVIVAASLGTAAAVSVTGLIGFVGIIVPHALRLMIGNSYRRLLPLSAIYGGVFLVLADAVARTALAPQEIPIGVVTALIGAPFFLMVLATSKAGEIS